jgi:hypothetical protein
MVRSTQRNNHSEKEIVGVAKKKKRIKEEEVQNRSFDQGTVQCALSKNTRLCMLQSISETP